MTIRQTHTFAVLEVPAYFYRFVRNALVEAGYDHAILNEEGEVLDMHGIALRAKPPASKKRTDQDLTDTK